MRHACLLLIAVVGLSATGCGVQRPHLANPGPIPYQQGMATYYDPYASVGTAKNMDDTRPRDFDRPASEVRNSQEILDQRRSGYSK